MNEKDVRNVAYQATRGIATSAETLRRASASGGGRCARSFSGAAEGRDRTRSEGFWRRTKIFTRATNHQNTSKIDRYRETENRNANAKLPNFEGTSHGIDGGYAGWVALRTA
ncbi:hypothetical protein CGCF413_v008439 [Colletotrichum fructicola]|nr:hypothetical protein CGCF413_v008439 [Colletotrichum fructicola]